VFDKLMLVSIGLVMLATGAVADELQPGDRLPQTVLRDQHGQEMVVSSNTAFILFAAHKGASDVINGYLANHEGDFLQRHQAVYIADLSEMPALITRMFALPKMRGRPYRILLTDEESPMAFLPRKVSAVTVISMRDGVVESVSYAENGDEIGALLAVATTSP
jgi:hypothetical protein